MINLMTQSLSTYHNTNRGARLTERVYTGAEGHTTTPARSEERGQTLIADEDLVRKRGLRLEL
jgi:hypothetical protein